MNAVYGDGVEPAVFVVIASRDHGDVGIGECIIIFEKHCGIDASHEQSNYEQER